MKGKKLKYKWEKGLDYFINNQKDYVVNNNPKKAIDKVSITHLKCGKTFSVDARRIRVSVCPCMREYGPKNKTHEVFVNQVEDIYGDEYTVLGKYINAKTPISIRHNVCNKEYEASPNALLSSSGCTHCFGREKLSHEEFLRTVRNLVGDEYSVLSKYTLSRNKIKMKHNVCNNEYLITPNKFITGRRCPVCRSSRGENRIREWFNNNNISYVPEYSFDDLRGDLNVPLKFDFAVKNKDGGIHSLIEFDGIQHFEPVDFFGGEEEFKRRKELDSMKNEYCLDKNLKLLRIPYTKKEELDKVLNEWLRRD